MGSLRVRHDWVTSLSLFTCMHWRRKWQPTPVFLPGESQGPGSLVGCHLWGRTESDMTEATEQLQQQQDCATRRSLVISPLPSSTMKMLVAQWRLTVCDPVHYRPPGFSVHGILQAGILEWVAIPFSRRSSWPKDQTRVSCTARRFFNI